jgi:hypothetical protein
MSKKNGMWLLVDKKTGETVRNSMDYTTYLYFDRNLADRHLKDVKANNKDVVVQKVTVKAI